MTTFFPSEQKPESWLRPNRRVLVAAIAVLLVMALAASAVTIVLWRQDAHWALKVPVALVAILIWIRVALLIMHVCQPRVAYHQGDLLLFLRRRRPIHVPVSVVECFFLGQTDTMLAPGSQQEPGEELIKTRSIVVRLAEAATDWHQRDVRPELGQWCDGYITIRGTWCEPMGPVLVKEMNSQLAAIHRQQRQKEKGI